MRRGDDSGVHADGLGITEPLDLPFFEHPQQLHLGIGRQVADLVEKNGGSIRKLEAPDLPIRRAGERPFLPAEQLALEQGVRHRGAVDPHHGPSPAGAFLVDVGGEQLLARPGFPQNQHCCVSRRNLIRELPYATERWALPDEHVSAADPPIFHRQKVHPGKSERNCEVCQYALEKLTGKIDRIAWSRRVSSPGAT